MLCWSSLPCYGQSRRSCGRSNVKYATYSSCPPLHLVFINWSYDRSSLPFVAFLIPSLRPYPSRIHHVSITWYISFCSSTRIIRLTSGCSRCRTRRRFWPRHLWYITYLVAFLGCNILTPRCFVTSEISLSEVESTSCETRSSEVQHGRSMVVSDVVFAPLGPRSRLDPIAELLSSRTPRDGEIVSV